MPIHHALCNNMSVQSPRSLCLFTGILGRDAEHIGVNSISFSIHFFPVCIRWGELDQNAYNAMFSFQSIYAELSSYLTHPSVQCCFLFQAYFDDLKTSRQCMRVVNGR